MTTFAPHESGIGVWVSGKLVAVIPRDALPALICASVNVLATITRPP